MSTHFLKKIFVFFVGVFLALFPALFVLAQSGRAALSVLPDTGMDPASAPSTVTSVAAFPGAVPTNTTLPPTIPSPTTPPPESPNSFPYVLLVFAVTLVLAPYGMARMLSQNKIGKKF